ncbi:MAG: MmgE/PrpD family protein, partial [Deltaproteobacteria bacterium]|nr:MmgE/PrpD family protein [Deltaproteobacteria bacterium]
HHGLICRDAIECCLLADAGITGPRHEIISGPKGYLGLAQWKTDPDLITSGFGERWEMPDVMMKTYTSCKGTHTAIEGIIDLMERHAFNAKDIASIHIDAATSNWNLTCIPKEEKWHPQTIPECQFSLPYTVAMAAYEKKIFLDSFTPEARSRKDVRNLMTQIHVTLNSNLPPWGAQLETILKDGRRFSGEYIKIKGHPQNPFTEQELIDKFMMCIPYAACPLEDNAVESVKNAILGLEEIDDVEKRLIIPLTPQ